MTIEQTIKVLDLAIIPYEDFERNDPNALGLIQKELYENGIVGIRGIPGYQAKVQQFIEANRAFSALPEEIKEAYAPDRSQGGTFLGYEGGKEKFQRPDGRWVIDDLKNSYYGIIPDCAKNKWPTEVDLKTPFQELGALMSDMGITVMKKIGLKVGDVYLLGRMLYYKGADSVAENPLWCGPHFDHGLFTSLIPAYYYVNGELVPEPPEAGLFIKTSKEGVYKKVIANDPDVMMFQVGEFAQLASNDAIRATEHQVHKAKGFVDRYSMALFIDPSMDTVIHSNSVLAQDSRYGDNPNGSCSYRHWDAETFKRSIVTAHE
jgi:isopenicillin N synthase-like dioxygenase